MHVESQIEKALLSLNSNQKEDELLLDTDKPLIVYYMALGCLDG